MKQKITSQFSKKNKEHIGLSPFALVFRGQKKTDKTQVRAIEFNMEEVLESELKTPTDILAASSTNKQTWLNVDGLDNPALMEQLSKSYKIDNNILSDVMNPTLRPKVQEFDRGIFTTIKMLQYNEELGQLSAENLSLIITKNSLLSFQEQPGTVFEPIRDRIRKHKSKIRISGSDYLAFTLLDIVVDNYIYIIGLLGEKIESLEENMTNDPNKKLLESINESKRELNFLRKCIKPAREMIQNLAKMESDYIHDENRLHFRELLDNINEATELSDNYREILYDQLNVYHSSMSTKLNEIMRILTVFSVIFIPLTFLVGVYGTNFVYLPEKDWHYGYFVMWGLMIVITLFMLWFFKRKRWI